MEVCMEAPRSSPSPEPIKQADGSPPKSPGTPPKTPPREQQVADESLKPLSQPEGFRKQDLPDHIKEAVRKHNEEKIKRLSALEEDFQIIDTPDAKSKEGNYSSIPIAERILALIQNHKKLTSTEGVFRLNGNLTEMTKIKKELIEDPFKDIPAIDSENADIHGLIGILKNVLTERNVSILEQNENTLGRMKAVIDKKDNPEAQLSALREFVSNLNQTQKIILIKILSIVSAITANSAVNLMTVKNLAIGLGPSLIPNRDKEIPDPNVFLTANAFCEVLFANARAIIPELRG